VSSRTSWCLVSCTLAAAAAQFNLVIRLKNLLGVGIGVSDDAEVTAAVEFRDELSRRRLGLFFRRGMMDDAAWFFVLFFLKVANCLDPRRDERGDGLMVQVVKESKCWRLLFWIGFLFRGTNASDARSK
jgi:hypothetical protein